MHSQLVVSDIRLYETLKAKIGEKEAEAFVEILDRKVENKFNDKKSELATKEDLDALRLATKEDLAALRLELSKEISGLRLDMSNLRLAKKEDLSGFRSEILRTVYLISVGQLLAIVSSVIAIILVLKK